MLHKELRRAFVAYAAWSARHDHVARVQVGEVRDVRNLAWDAEKGKVGFEFAPREAKAAKSPAAKKAAKKSASKAS
jgi:hypothetical protein